MKFATLDFMFRRISLLQKSRGASKNHYADIENCLDGGVIPNFFLTRGERAFNPAQVVETYMSMRSTDEGDSTRFMMQAKLSVKFQDHGCKPVTPSAKGQKFNLHDPAVKTCFMGGVKVIGKNVLSDLCPKFSGTLGLPRVTNRDMRATAIQALRMAKFSTEEVCKISRHKRAATVERNYNIGLHSDQRANMAAAIAQAPLLKRGHKFQSVSEYLPRKTSLGQVRMANPADMVPTGGDGEERSVERETSKEESGPLEEGVVVKESAEEDMSPKEERGSLEEGVALVGKESAEEEILPKFEEKKMQVEEEVPFVGLELVVECDGGFGDAAHGVEIEMANAHDR